MARFYSNLCNVPDSATMLQWSPVVKIWLQCKPWSILLMASTYTFGKWWWFFYIQYLAIVQHHRHLAGAQESVSFILDPLATTPSKRGKKWLDQHCFHGDSKWQPSCLVVSPAVRCRGDPWGARYVCQVPYDRCNIFCLRQVHLEKDVSAVGPLITQTQTNNKHRTLKQHVQLQNLPIMSKQKLDTGQ